MSTSQPHEDAALQRYEPGGVEQALMPALSIERAVERYRQLTEFVSKILRPDVDYGVIPGTDKRTLLKPGAEKLTTFFGLTKEFILAEKIEDWYGTDHGGQPFFYYLYRCRLLRGDVLIAEADGSCNSRETKYRWREAKRMCPACGQAAIIKGKEEFGGGWLCWKKQGGCGAKYADGAREIEDQPAGRVENPDVCDLVNTIQKMAQKRSLTGACLLAVNASEFFTQDVEDFDQGVINVTPTKPAAEAPQPQQQPAKNGPQRAQRPPQPAQPRQTAPANGGRQVIKKIGELREKLMANGVEETVLNEMLGNHGCTEVVELTDEDARQYLAELSELINETLRSARSDFDEEDQHR